MKNYKHTLFAPFATFAPCVLLFAFCVNDNADNGIDCLPCGENAKTAYRYFVELSAVPRCTYNEKAASDFLISFAESFGFETYQDSIFNTLIKKKGSAGREGEPPVILQAHIDMVCRKDSSEAHDFETDPIIPVIGGDGDIITAQKRTTLGADDGSGVSIIMAILASRRASHPPIEALLTTREEAGLLGADFFDVSRLNGRRLINIDATKEEVFIVSSKLDEGSEIIIPLEPAVLAKIAVLPEWPYKQNSPLREKMLDVFKDFYKSEPVFAGINNRIAGVECLVFAGKIPDIDMVSIGVDIFDIHSPNESMSLSSLGRVHEYLVRLLEKL